MEFVDPIRAQNDSSDRSDLLFVYGQLLDLLGKHRSEEALLSGQTGAAFGEAELARSAHSLGFDFEHLRPKADELRWMPTPCILHDADQNISVLVAYYDEVRGHFCDRAGRPINLLEHETAEGFSAFFLKTKSIHKVPDRANEKSWFFDTLWDYSPVYRDVLAASLLVQVFALAMPLFIMNVYDRVVPNQALETLWALSFGVGLVIILDLVLKLVRQKLLESTALRVDQRVGDHLFSKLMHIELDRLPKGSGHLSSLMQQFDQAKTFFTSATFVAFVDVPFSILFMLMVGFIGGALVWIPLTCAALILILGGLTQRKLKYSIARSQSATSDKQNALIESLVHIEAIHAFGLSAKRQGLWEQVSRESNSALGQTRLLSGRMSVYAQSINQFSLVALVVLGVYQIHDNALSLGALLACVLLSSRILGPMTQAASLWAHYFQVKMSLAQLSDLVNLPSEVFDKNFVTMPKEKSDLRLENVSFAYPGAQKRAIEEVSFTIGQGEKVALLGRVGSGKSTLLRCIVRLSLPQKGCISIGEADLADLHPADIRSRVGYVPQSAALFAGTLRENILAGHIHIDDSYLVQACEMAGLSGFLKQNRQGLDYELGELGEGLSGGQKQCVAIARALVNHPDMIVLDEVASSLDNQTEQKLLANLKQASASKTLIVSTHKSSVLALVDRIIVLDQGRLIADGPKDSVLSAIQSGSLRVRD